MKMMIWRRRARVIQCVEVEALVQNLPPVRFVAYGESRRKGWTWGRRQVAVTAGHFPRWSAALGGLPMRWGRCRVAGDDEADEQSERKFSTERANGSSWG